MTDKLHYQDMFKTINIPKSERRIALHAKHLFDTAHGLEPWNPGIHLHLLKAVDAKAASQLFWEFENHDEQLYDQIVLTVMKQGLVIAMEHRHQTDRTQSLRRSMAISAGIATVYDSATGSTRHASDLSSETFKQTFFDQAAVLGLSPQPKRGTDGSQNDSRSAIFASAA